MQKQRATLQRSVAEADIVVTTAQVFKERAPLLVTAEMLASMRLGSVVVDLAVESGGNVEGVVLDQIVEISGVTVIGLSQLARRVPADASQTYSANLTNLIAEFWDKSGKTFVLNLADEIIRGSLVTHGGKICQEHLAAATTEAKAA